jgi:Aminotransferase class I and II
MEVDIALHGERFYAQKINRETEVLITSGATEAVFAASLGLTDPGDEITVFEPAFYQDSDKDLGRYLARFASCKKEEILAAATEKLSSWGNLRASHDLSAACLKQPPLAVNRVFSAIVSRVHPPSPALEDWFSD